MPDKHEVGGSSPLGPTSRTKRERSSLIKRKRAFLKRSEEISLLNGSSPLGSTSI